MENKNSGIQENKNSKNSGGQKILAVVVGVVVAAFAVIMIFAAASTHGGGSSEKESAAKTFKKADVVGNWQVESSSMKKGYSLYYVFDDDKNVKEYQTKKGKFDWYKEGTYTLSGNKIKMKLDTYTFYSDLSTKPTSTDISETETVKKKSKDKIIFTQKVDGDTYVTPMARISDDEIKKLDDMVAQKRSDQQARIDAKKPKEHTFGAGKYTCGKDFEPGTYDLIALSGSGNVFCDDEGLNEILGTDSDYATPSYKGEAFVDGDVLEIQDTLQLKLSPQE